MTTVEWVPMHGPDRYILLATDSTRKAPAAWDGYLGTFATLDDALAVTETLHPRYDGFGIEDQETKDLVTGILVDGEWEINRP